MSKQAKRWNATRIVKELALLMLILFIANITINYFRAPKLDDDSLPIITATLIDGSRFDVAKEKPIMIHFWGSWCPICVQEASNIASLAKGYQVLTIAVNSGSDAEVAAWLKQRNLNFPVRNDPNGQLAERFKVTVFPTTFIYNAQHKLAFTETGYSTTIGLAARLKLVQ